MNIIEVEVRETLDELYHTNAICLLGLERRSFGDFLAWLKDVAEVKLKEDFTIFWVTGEKMNRFYGLTGSNAYPDDLDILLISLWDTEDIGKLPMLRFEIDGLKWFCDVVDNNEVRERDQRWD